MKFIKALFVVLLATVSMNSFAQMVNMGDPGYPESNPADCSVFGTAANNFQDPGAAGNYPPNYTGTTTFCPTLGPDSNPITGTKMSITMAINAGYTFNVDGSDFIYVYDGPTTASPLLGIHNSVSDPTGFTHQATWNNPSGCLTIEFVSDGANEGTGWLANVQCGNQFQPFEPHIEAYINGVGANALNPIDTGYVDVCFGDSIMFIAKPIFPYSQEASGNGYSQNVNSSINFNWEITDGGVYPNNDTIWFTPPARAGYLVDVVATDQFPQQERMRCKVRVSQLPSFAGTGPLDPIICLGESTELIGGVTAQDTVGVDIPPGTFNLGGNFAGLTYLPDGSGQQYQAPITIGGFPSGSVINDAQSLNQVCITMEHSYLGDLEIWLQCPSGQIVPLVNSYSPGNIPGGNSGGGTFLGHPFDDAGGGGAGVGWEYCFSSVFNDIGPMTQNLGNTVPVAFIAGTPNLSAGNSMNSANTYAPETTFASFAGCPVNGNWTIFVQDNLGIDDGYIFEWGLYFDGSYFPGLGSYQNTVNNSFWSPDPTIISGQTDTLIVVQPNVTGNYSYTFNIVDDFGCPYDTTVSLLVQALPEIFNDTIGCDFTFQVAGTTSVAGGTWTTSAPNLSFLPNANVVNPVINSTTAGTYTVTFTDIACNTPVSATITYPPYPIIFNDTSLCSLTFPITGTQAYSTGGVWSASSPNVTFTPSTTTLNPTINASSTGNYIITFTDNVCNNSVSSEITQIIPPSIFPDVVACNLLYQVTNTISWDGGVWTASDTAVHFSTSTFESNPEIWTSTPGTYDVTFTDNYCGISVSSTIVYPPFAYTQVLDTTICLGTEYTIYANQNPTVSDFVWNTGATGPSIVVNGPGDYIVTGSNVCHSYSDTATIQVEICSIEAPNVISLSSTVGNNTWFVQYEGLETFNCTILNRWGNKIYEYTDPNGSWDGRTSGGTVVEEGTYFYIIKAQFFGAEEEITKQGFVQVRY
jgi:subtilisin-like proprotein convertase family protein